MYLFVWCPHRLLLRTALHGPSLPGSGLSAVPCVSACCHLHALPDCSFQASASDAALFKAIGKAPDAGKYPNLARYYSHIASFTEAARNAFPATLGAGAKAAPAAAKPAAAAGAGKKAAAPAPAADEDDAADLFGDDDGDASAKIAAASKAAKKDEPKAEKKVKAPVIAKTSVIYEVKPQEAGQDMAALEAKIRSIEMDGLMWGGEFKVVDVAFGIQKLIVQGIVEDEKVPLDDLEERMQSFKEEVSSIDQIAMNKVG